MPEQLREGFTTGTAASAAAYAAVSLLLSGTLPADVNVDLPPFTNGEKERQRLSIPIEQGGLLAGTAWASVIKDGGDDPDATHGARILAYASLAPFEQKAAQEDGPAGFPPPLPEPPVSICVSGFGPDVYLYGGPGIGTATLPGLPVAVGEPAINPEPRKQVAFAVAKAAQGHKGPFHILLSVPDGRERAAKTLNPRLGILGGISILGTRGIVRPYSHEAWTGTIQQALSVAQALGIREVLLSTGRRSERLAFALNPAFSPQAGIQVADYAAFAVRGAARRGFAHVHWACFPGKLLKLAQGLEWTHAGAAPADIPLLVRLGREEGISDTLAAKAEGMPTVAGVFALLAGSDRSQHDRVLLRLARMAGKALRTWADEERGNIGGEDLRVTLYVFSSSEELLLRLEA